MIRPVILTLALAASAGAAWGQTTLIDLGKVQGGGAPPTLTISDECKAIPQFSGASACICPDGHMIDVGQHCSDTSRPTRTYTLADLDRLRKVEWRLLGTDAMTPWEFKMLIEERVASDIAAGISPEALEAKTREGK